MRKLLLLALSATMLTGCYQGIDEDAEQKSEQTKTFHFTIKGDWAELTRAGSLTADGREMTDLWLFDVQDGAIVQTVHQTPSDATWGVPTIRLTLGAHSICIVASRGTAPAIDGTSLKWQKVGDTFCKLYPVDVVPTSNGNRSVTLDRMVAQLRLTIDDAIPEGLTELRVAPASWFDGIRVTDCQPIAAEAGAYRSIQMLSTDEGETGFTAVAYTIAPESYTTDVTLSAYTGTTLTSSATIQDVELRRNTSTTYHGNMFGGAEASTITLSAQWSDPIDGGTW